MDEILLLAAVALLAVVQSVFGVGLLLFGTPLLLMAGYSYLELLYVLLPASATLSTLQLVFDHSVRPREVGGYALWVVPAILVGTVTSLLYLTGLDIRIPVAVLLAVTGVLRLSRWTRQRLQTACVAAGRPALSLIALAHGLTNMGGGLLAVYAGALSDQKREVHRTVAVVYLLFAGSQLVALYVLHGPPTPDPRLLMSTVGVAVPYLLLGRRVFQAMSDRRYQAAFSAFMLCCAGVLTWQAAQ
ncbi:sulfite exporter TauE/SafE family protein [Micromonospora sp. WMMD882]|uniref:sulfite exporter TauE/SafE family protein n=1 Tax=Micromonospora sp. WMMD882 TaxID=3015151 RepID=UPI00248BB241|nr:sulfite exporter TauE/SafE family protein [Micromonospora sp. WMMD882]WBB78450.1 sulfite exporter TauE/SafE family protein [Micromonospora sp. WMMD882]